MQNTTEVLTSKLKLSHLRKLCGELSERYRQGLSPYLLTEDHRLAYLITRFPATFGAIQKVLTEIKDFRIESMLDLGAGPGTGYGAAKTLFSIQSATCVESDPSFVRLGKEIYAKEPIQWLQKDLKQPHQFSEHDLVLFSYSIGEIQEVHWDTILGSAWKSTRKALVIIEPGTPAGFERIRKLRDKLVALGGQIVAPCPHADKCLMSGGDWCHFAARVQRTSQHRQAKEGELGFEDEKFSYIIVGKEAAALPEARILRHPVKQKGRIGFSLCTRTGLKTQTITKKDREFYKQVKRLSWGDRFMIP
jgi:ribosomal protein RSM22 (predicted rRNA methylase)